MIQFIKKIGTNLLEPLGYSETPKRVRLNPDILYLFTHKDEVIKLSDVELFTRSYCETHGLNYYNLKHQSFTKMFVDQSQEELEEFKISISDMLHLKFDFLETRGIVQFEENKSIIKANKNSMISSPIGFSQMESCNSLFHALHNIAKAYS